MHILTDPSLFPPPPSIYLNILGAHEHRRRSPHLKLNHPGIYLIMYHKDFKTINCQLLVLAADVLQNIHCSIISEITTRNKILLMPVILPQVSFRIAKFRQLSVYFHQPVITVTRKHVIPYKSVKLQYICYI